MGELVLVSPKQIGDTLLATPAIRARKRAHPDERITVGICASSSAKPVLNAVLTGTRRNFTDRNLIYVFLNIPAMTIKVIAAIHWEALRLWVKGIRLRSRPNPPERAATIVTANSAISD